MKTWRPTTRPVLLMHFGQIWAEWSLAQERQVQPAETLGVTEDVVRRAGRRRDRAPRRAPRSHFRVRRLVWRRPPFAAASFRCRGPAPCRAPGVEPGWLAAVPPQAS